MSKLPRQLKNSQTGDYGVGAGTRSFAFRPPQILLATPTLVARRMSRSIADHLDLVGLRTFRTLANHVLDHLVLGERAKALLLDGSMVDKNILSTIIRRDETKTLRVVEPLYLAACHCRLLLRTPGHHDPVCLLLLR